MATELDPAGVELHTIRKITDLRKTRVLEIGAGDGRLTFRYARYARIAVAMDTKPADIHSAARNCPAQLRAKARFLRASGTALPFPAETFDVLLFSSSL